MMERIFNHPWFTKLIAFAFAVLLFTYVNYENNSVMLTTGQNTFTSASTTELISGVPIVIDLDQEAYMISGLPETVDIQINGPVSMVRQAVATQNFDIVASDLESLGVGTHTISLVAEGLPSEVTYTIIPSEATITIEERRTETYGISLIFDESLIADGYSAGTPTMDYDSVTISGAASVIEQIENVNVLVTSESGTNEDIQQTSPVLVSNSQGDILDVETDPSEVTVTIPVEPVVAELPIDLTLSGVMEPDLEYGIELDDGESGVVTVTGNQELLNSLSSFPVTVDVTDITETSTEEIELPLPEGLTSVSPESITVTVTVTEIEQSETSEEDPAESEQEADAEESTTADANSAESSESDSETTESESSESEVDE